VSAELTRTIETIRDKRLHAARAAAQLSIIGRENGVSVEGIPWDVLPAIPDWCLLDAKERHTLQRVCGALYLAPLIKNSIDGGVLRKLNIFVGDAIFQHVRTTDDLTHSIEPRGFENHVEVQVMAAGSSVLLHTLQVTSLMELYKTAGNILWH